MKTQTMKALLIPISILLLTVSCSTTPKVAEVELPTAELQSGRTIYQKKCHRCHKLKVIDNYSAEQWDNILPDMASKSRLSDADEALVKAYVVWELAN